MTSPLKMSHTCQENRLNPTVKIRESCLVRRKTTEFVIIQPERFSARPDGVAMFLSAKVEYACLAMLELAAQHGSPKPIRLSDVADKHGIPQRFLVQILLQLKGARLVASTRGAAGGYQLTRSPERITLADILNVIDRQDTPEERNLTPSALAGRLQAVWRRIDQAREKILSETPLSDLLPNTNGTDYMI